MSCDEIKERMLDVAAGLTEPTAEERAHLAICHACAAKLEEMRQTMALLDEWQSPEPTPYFDVRLQARLREEMAKPQGSWLRWFRRPALAAALTVLMGVGLIFFRGHGLHNGGEDEVASMDVQPGTAVGDLQALDRNHELYADFDLLDDLEVQQDVVANP
jgi:predicted anti-sigma-YlaC factor YlaD